MSLLARPPHILLVEDSDDDAFFFERVARRSGTGFQLTHVINGLLAVDVLKKSATDLEPSPVPPPDLIFLDLKLPQLNGFEVLSWVQQHTFVSKLAIVVLSGSEDSGDIRKAKDLGATACFAKPLELGQFQSLFKQFGFPAPTPAVRPAAAALPSSATSAG